MCKIWQISFQSPRCPAQRCDLEPIHEPLLTGFILADQGSRRLHKDGDEQKFPKNARFDTVRTTTSENTDRTQRCIQYANTAEMEHISLVRNNVAKWSSSKMDQDESSRVFRFDILWWRFESRSAWNEHGFVETYTLPAEIRNSFGTYYHVHPLLTSRGIFRGIWTAKVQNFLTRGSSSCLWSTTLSAERKAIQKPFAQRQRSGSFCNPIQTRTLVPLGARVRKYVVERKFQRSSRNGCACTSLIWVQSRDNVMPHPSVICSAAPISCPTSSDFVLSFLFCSGVSLVCCYVGVSTPTPCRWSVMKDFGLFVFSLLSGTHLTHRSMCGSHRLVLLTLLSMSLLPLGIGLEIAASGLDTSTKQLITSVVHIVVWWTFSSVPLWMHQISLCCTGRDWPFTSLDVISTHSCSIHLVFLREQVTFHSLCATLWSGWSHPCQLCWKWHNTRTQFAPEFMLHPVSVLRGCPHGDRHFDAEGWSFPQKVGEKCPRQGCWLFDGWRIFLEVFRWFRTGTHR